MEEAVIRTVLLDGVCQIRKTFDDVPYPIRHGCSCRCWNRDQDGCGGGVSSGPGEVTASSGFRRDAGTSILTVAAESVALVEPDVSISGIGLSDWLQLKRAGSSRMLKRAIVTVTRH